MKNTVQKFRAHMAAIARNEDGMEAAQVILILIVVVGLIALIKTQIIDRLSDRAEEVGAGIDGI